MSAEAAVGESRRRRFHLLPRTVRWRLTAVAAIVFAVAFSAAAFGLVRVVHNNLVDRINETNQQQLDALQAAVNNGALEQPHDTNNAYCYVGQDGRGLCQLRPPPNDGIAARREIQTAAGNIFRKPLQQLTVPGLVREFATEAFGVFPRDRIVTGTNVL